MLTGQFADINGVVWTVRIIGTDLTGTMEFPATAPLIIEWPEKDKEEVICGSMATLKVSSLTDRQYLSLYSEEVGAVRLDVLRNGTLWWSGSLDTEFYEEPYSWKQDYDVTLTFSDLGQLSRLKYNLTGLQTYAAVVWDAISRLGLNTDLDIDQTYISTLLDGSKVTLASLMIDSANFVDEEEEKSTLHDALTGMMQPLGLRMVQRSGKIWIYDLNGLAKGLESEEVYWMGTDAVLGVDKVYNSVKMTFSPYVRGEVLDGEMDTDVDTSNLGGEGSTYHTFYKGYHYDSSDDYDEQNEGDKDFTLFTDATISGYTAGDVPVGVFRRIYGGEDSEFFAPLYTYGQAALSDTDNPPTRVVNCGMESAVSCPLVTRSERVLMPALDASSCYMRLVQEMLIDVRYNPFRDAAATNEKGNYTRATKDGWTALVMTPFRLRLYDASGNVLYHYKNDTFVNTRDAEANLGYKGAWVSGDYNSGQAYGANNADTYAYLSWYQASDLKGTQITGSWVKNKQTMSRYAKSADSLVGSAPAGQYIPYPPAEGYLEIEIYANIAISDTSTGTSRPWESTEYAMLRWLLFKAPAIDLVETVSPFNTVESDDIEYSGVLNANAAEELNIETVCGTASGDIPCARGCILDADGEQIHSLSRNGVSDVAEQLMIGTLFSAYARRHAKLSGTVRTEADFVTLRDACTGELFMLTAERMDAREGESHVTMVEVGEDEYAGS